MRAQGAHRLGRGVRDHASGHVERLFVSRDGNVYMRESASGNAERGLELGCGSSRCSGGAHFGPIQ